MITASILTHNEESNIARCINSLDWCDEVVVIDDHSSDATTEIAIQLGARVLTHKFESFAKQRNWAIANGEIKTEWVLHLDADEVSTDSFRRNVQTSIAKAPPECRAFATCRKTMLFGKWLKYSDGFPVWIMRISRNGIQPFRDSGHGEVPIPDNIKEHIQSIREPFIHYAFSKGISNWIDRHNRYSSREAQAELNEGVSFRRRDLLSTDAATRRKALRNLSRRMPGRPLLRFVYQYFIKLGFLDGSAGFTFSLLMATYEWFIVLKKTSLSKR